ncbi:hypothetical protein H8D91_00230, partial [archaeon]|nr:hypothetical protein [archaeon]
MRNNQLAQRLQMFQTALAEQKVKAEEKKKPKKTSTKKTKKTKKK